MAAAGTATQVLRCNLERNMRVANLKTKQQTKHPTNRGPAWLAGVAAHEGAHARLACARKGREWGNARFMAMPCGRRARVRLQ